MFASIPCNDRSGKCYFMYVNSNWGVSSSSSPSPVTSQDLIGFFRPRLIVPSKAFQVVFVHLFYNSALLLASWYMGVKLGR